MKLSHIAGLVTAAALIGCEGPVPSEPTPDGTGASLNRVTASTTGGGQAQLPPGFSALKLSFNAKAKADGSAQGVFSQLYETASGTVDFAGTVTCVTFDAALGRAWIGGVITRNTSTHPAVQADIHQPGRDVWFRVVDNGEGQGAVDRTTVFGFEGAIATSADYCAMQLWTADDANTWPVVNGNIQVRP